jgi:hypothetical protein
VFRICVPILALLLAACRQHPCGDATESLPKELANLPLVHAGGQVCSAESGGGTENPVFATIEYWGDDTAELKETHAVALAGAGWTAIPCGQLPKPDGVDRLCFTSADERLELHFEQRETGRLGSSFAAPSMRVEAYWTLDH